MDYKQVVKLKEVVKLKNGKDVLEVVNANDLHTQKEQMRVYHHGTKTALESRPDYISLCEKFVVDVMELKNSETKDKKTVISIDND